MENLDPPSLPNQGWENGVFLPFARLHPWFGGDGGLLFHFVQDCLKASTGVTHSVMIAIMTRNLRSNSSKLNAFKANLVICQWTHTKQKNCAYFIYRIYSINRPGRLINFWTLIVGAYSRWALLRGWALIKFSLFSASEVCLFCNKTINANNKTRRSNKARFLYDTLKKTPSSGKSLIRIYSLNRGGWGWPLIWVWLGGGGGGRLFEVGANSRLGAYSNKYGNCSSLNARRHYIAFFTKR